jgi:activator of HSP90 ATPase
MSLDFTINFAVPYLREVMQYTRCPCQIEPKVGGAYKLLEGKILGQFKSLTEGKEIELDWKFDNWANYSTVKITFNDREV